MQPRWTFVLLAGLSCLTPDLRAQTELYYTPLYNDPSLVAYYRMQGNANDSKGSNNGTPTNVAFGTAYGKFGQGAAFHGSSSSITIPNNPSLQITGGITISAWVYPAAGVNWNAYPTIYATDGFGNGYAIITGTGGAVYFFYGYPGTPHFSSTGTLNAGQWNSVVCTFDGSNMHIYINGNLDATSAAVTPNPVYTNAVPEIGSEYGFSNQTWRGYIDDLAIFSRALSATEVSDIYSGNWPAPLALAFPVPSNSACLGPGGECDPTTAPITAVFDHNMGQAYESSMTYSKTGCAPKATVPPGYGHITAFTGESASGNPVKPGYGQCNDLYGYQNPTVTTFLNGYNYRGGSVLWYDSHPGFDYGFAYGTPVFPAVAGCVSYTVKVPHLSSPAAGHVLTIIPNPVQPPGGICPAPPPGYAPSYAVVYMHLSSYLDPNTGLVMKCVVPGVSDPGPKACATGSSHVQPCPECAQPNQWVPASPSALIGYTGNFLGYWSGVDPHLHFEVDLTINGVTNPVDPYGWTGSPSGDPYVQKHPGFVNSWLWQ